MKKLVAGMVVIMLALFAIGCCDSVGKAKDLVDTAKETGETITRFSEDIEKLQKEDGGFKLTEVRLERFLKQYPIFVEITNKYNEENSESESDFDQAMVGMEVFLKLDKELRSAGIDNPAEFFLSMGKVSAIVFYLSSQKYLASAKDQMSEAVKTMKEQIESPDVSEEQKAIMREAIAEMEGSAETTDDIEIPDEVSETELELVRKNFERIAETMGIEVKPSEEA